MNTACWQALADLLRSAIEALDAPESQASETLVSALDIVSENIQDSQEVV